MEATSSSAACGPDWKNDPIDTRSRRPATSSWTAAAEPVGVPSGSPWTSPARRSHRALSSPVATDMRSVASTPGSSRRWGSSAASGGWATRQAGAGDDVVGALGAEAGAAVRPGRDPHRRAVPDGLDAAARLDHRRLDAADAAEGIGDDGEAGGALGVDRRGAASRIRHSRRAGTAHGGIDPVGRRVDDVDHVGPRPVLLRRRDLGDDRLAGHRSADEHDAPVVVACERVTPGDEAVRTEHEAAHRPGCYEHPVPLPSAWMARPIQIAPSVLPADFARLGEEVASLEKAGVDLIQWDVMDGQFVPNLTFGPDVIAAAREHATVPFEAHLMVLTPEAMAARYVEAGCRRLIVHAEATGHLHRTLGHIGELGAERRRRAQPGDAAGRDRPRARPRRPRPRDDRQSRLRRAALPRVDGAEDHRGAAR